MSQLGSHLSLSHHPLLLCTITVWKIITGDSPLWRREQWATSWFFMQNSVLDWWCRLCFWPWKSFIYIWIMQKLTEITNSFISSTIVFDRITFLCFLKHQTRAFGGGPPHQSRITALFLRSLFPTTVQQGETLCSRGRDKSVSARSSQSCAADRLVRVRWHAPTNHTTPGVFLFPLSHLLIEHS